MKLEEIYISGEYLKKWPTWHVEISPWSAKQITRMMVRNQLTPKTTCEVGCGAGEILKRLQVSMSDECIFWGYEISPQAFELCQTRANERLHFKLADFTKEKDIFFDLILIIDVIEHIEDYFTFLREIKPKSLYKIIHFPLDLTVRAIMHGNFIKLREDHGHIHYFTRDVALQILKDIDFEVIDYFYTSPSIDIPTNDNKAEFRRKLMRLPRKILFAIDNDLAARVLGGYSLMVLAK